MSLGEVEMLCVHPFAAAARTCRERLFLSFEELVQALLVAKIKCDVFLDGSFLTRKPEPDDVDVIVSVEHGVFEALDGPQNDLLHEINNERRFRNLDGCALVAYPRDHERFGSAADLGNAGECYGVEHGQTWLKGYAVIRIWEVDVRNRLCR